METRIGYRARSPPGAGEAGRQKSATGLRAPKPSIRAARKYALAPNSRQRGSLSAKKLTTLSARAWRPHASKIRAFRKVSRIDPAWAVRSKKRQTDGI